MPSVTKLARLARLATLPETRGAVAAAARSEALRGVAWRARNDPIALARELRHPANARGLLRSAVRHPATRELASAGVVLLPWRYVPLGWAATWMARRALRRYVEPADDAPGGQAGTYGPER